MLLSSLRRGLLTAVLPLAAAVSGCSAPADAVSSSSANALSSNPAFSFEPRGEGESGGPADADLRNAYWLAYASFEMYAPGGEAEVKASLHQIPDLQPIAFQWFTDPGSDSVAMYLRTPVVAFLAYKGTNFGDPEQRALLLDLTEASTTVGEAHAGFVRGFDALWSSARPYLLQDFVGSNVPLYLAGHSLGGAYATLTTLAVLHDDAFSDGNGGSRLAATYTFGSPRVGNSDFSDDLTTELAAQGVGFFRLVNDLDAVPGLLPAFPYSHPGRKVSGITDITSGSLIVHEEQDLVWLDASGTAYYGGDGQSRCEWRWDDSLPQSLDAMSALHNGYFKVLAPHQ